jgi:hypothetical protein
MKSVEIILRTCDTANVHTDWRQRYVNLSKTEIVLGCLNSLIHSAEQLQGVKLTVLDDHSQPSTIQSIAQRLGQTSLECELVHLKGLGYNHSALEQFDRARQSTWPLVYTVEDDYLHQPTALEEMWNSYQLFSTRLNNPWTVLYPFDTPEEYRPPNRLDRIVHGSARHWRTGVFSTNVLFTAPSLFADHWALFERLASRYNGDYLNPRTEHVEESNTIWSLWNGGPAVRFNPIPSLALHLQFEEQRDPFINWQTWWSQYAV